MFAIKPYFEYFEHSQAIFMQKNYLFIVVIMTQLPSRSSFR